MDAEYVLRILVLQAFHDQFSGIDLLDFVFVCFFMLFTSKI